jgi:hypothetical protein
MAEQLDLSGSLRGEVSLKPEEHVDDRAARIRNEARAALIEDCKGVAVFVGTLLGLGAVACVAGYKGVFDPAANPETQRWAQAVLTAVVSGSISFVLGRKVSK